MTGGMIVMSGNGTKKDVASVAVELVDLCVYGRNVQDLAELIVWPVLL